MSHCFDPILLRDYDLRGTVGDTLHAADAWALGRSFGTVIARAGGRRIAVGRDGRLSSPMLEDALVAGLVATGIAVLRIGLGPTPMLYHAEMTADVDGGIQITGSHNPGDQNGFKLVHRHAPFFGADIQTLGAMAAAGDWESGAGAVDTIAIMDAYVARLMQGFDGPACRIGWDAGNGAAGPVVEKLAQLLPGEHHLLFTQPDGHFPNHHPDPSEEKNLADLRALVRDKRLDFGVAFDGDGDRIGVVDGRGRVIAGDQLLGLFAQHVLQKRPGALIVADVKASQTVFDRITDLGGQPDMWKTGHSHIKSRMKQTGSPLGGETTGHLFFADDYPGYDDGLYAAVRLIRLVSALGQSVTRLCDGLPTSIITPELRFPVPESRKFAVIGEVLARLRAAGADICAIDGARVRTPVGWWLLRASNTQAALVARAEACDESGLALLLGQLDSHLADSGVSRGSESEM
ncbi:phosphomannomutase/phosphoglucomutase [Sphingobium sp. HBC34]|uniref:Phosphomannomutase/phosphoglucomutase n=1 Tax=Sphingobium cyanobacteriorum TaxID=3063954 RepID=A0ABT8ZNU9_9SPHN|nr:phosphomannomutase/phosphoglucomutase [Sphingobium sp. HBC34]MDO7835793.1 phosphomannomutase/phosphoglucomutase [Sphingobium sp. HBC34]